MHAVLGGRDFYCVAPVSSTRDPSGPPLEGTRVTVQMLTPATGGDASSSGLSSSACPSVLSSARGGGGAERHLDDDDGGGDGVETRWSPPPSREATFELSIRTPCTPSRWLAFDAEMMHAWNEVGLC